MEDAAAVKIPIYNNIDPALWFAMCESTFALATPKAITDPVTKYNYCVAHLPPDTASLVRDIILRQRTETSYDELKAAITERCGESSTQEIRKLLAGEQLGDRKPSELLRVMKRRAEKHDVSDSLLLELFLQQLPSNVQTILASVESLKPEQAASTADRILEVTPMQVSTISQNSASNADYESLSKEIRKLRNEVSFLRRNRSRSFSRKRFGRKRSPSVKNASNFCWYHRKFDENAQKCVPPCSFKGNEQGKA
jgi:hypothetical protein